MEFLWDETVSLLLVSVRSGLVPLEPDHIEPRSFDMGVRQPPTVSAVLYHRIVLFPNLDISLTNTI